MNVPEFSISEKSAEIRKNFRMGHLCDMNETIPESAD